MWLRLTYNRINIFYLEKFLGKYILSHNSITKNREYHIEKVKNVIKFHLNNINCSKKIKVNFLIGLDIIYFIREFKYKYAEKKFLY